MGNDNNKEIKARALKDGEMLESPTDKELKDNNLPVGIPITVNEIKPYNIIDDVKDIVENVIELGQKVAIFVNNDLVLHLIQGQKVGKQEVLEIIANLFKDNKDQSIKVSLNDTIELIKEAGKDVKEIQEDVTRILEKVFGK